MSLFDEKLINVINKSFSSQVFLNGSVSVVKRPAEISYAIQINEKNNCFLVPERLLSILSFKDLTNIPGRDYPYPDTNPISEGMAKFCKAFEKVDQRDFEQFGKEVLLEGLKSNHYSMVFGSDPFRLYLLEKHKVFKPNLDQNGLRLTYEFLKSYGRLPFPEENIDKPDTVVLFKEKVEVPVGIMFQIPGAAPSEKILVTINSVNKTFFQAQRYFTWTTNTVLTLTFRILETGFLTFP